MDPDRQFIFATIRSVRSRHRHFHRRSLQESQVEQRIDHHTRAAGKDFAFFKAKVLLIKIAELFWFRRNECDMPELSHVSPPRIGRLLKKPHMLRCAQLLRCDVRSEYASAHQCFARLASKAF